MNTTKSMLVQVIGAPLNTGDRHDIGRYREIVPFPSTRIQLGEVVAVFDRKGNKIVGKLLKDEHMGKGLVLDTFATLNKP